MNFNSFEYAIFWPKVFILYWWLPHRYRWGLLLLDSCYFYIVNFFCENESFAGVIKLEAEMRNIGREYNIQVHGGYAPAFCHITEDDFMDWLHLKPEKMLENYEYVQ